jgi:pilus assembly protein CpaE
MSMDEMDGLKEKIRVVVNRVGLENGQISMKKARETIGREIFKQIPNDYRVMAEVRNNGVPLVDGAPRAGLTQAILELADALCGGGDSTAEPVSTTGSANWLNFWPALAKARGKA